VTEHRHSPLSLGEIIRRQRELAELPMRQLATMVGISSPYLSQIERGLRAPSEKVLHAIAASLRTSADALVQQAEPEWGPPPALRSAIAADPNLTPRQRQVLTDVYTALIESTIAHRRRGRRADGERPGR